MEFYLAGFSTQALAVTDTVDTDEKALASIELRKMIRKGWFLKTSANVKLEKKNIKKKNSKHTKLLTQLLSKIFISTGRLVLFCVPTHSGLLRYKNVKWWSKLTCLNLIG